MSNFPGPFNPNRTLNYEGVGESSQVITRFFNSVYAWMCVGLAVTAVVALYTSQHVEILMSLGRGGLLFLMIAEVALVVVVASAVNKVSAPVATALFIAYAALNGLTLSFIFLLYAKAAIASAFVVSAGTFGALSVYGFVTKRDLTAAGRILTMMLIGLVIASIVSLFWHNSVMQVVMNYLGVFIFAGLTAYDTQKLKAIAEQTEGNPALAARLSITGSLILYLDFINLFIFILRTMNDRRN